MKIKIAGGVAKHAADALAPYAETLYQGLGRTIVVIAELTAIERLEIADEEKKDPSVTLQLKHLEVAGTEQEENVRRAMRALNTQRTANGTLTEDHDVELSAATLGRCAGDLHAIDASRLRVAVDEWQLYARRAAAAELTESELRHELTIVADALRGVLYPSAVGA